MNVPGVGASVGVGLMEKLCESVDLIALGWATGDPWNCHNDAAVDMHRPGLTAKPSAAIFILISFHLVSLLGKGLGLAGWLPLHRWT